MLKGIEQRVSRSCREYHEAYKELELYIGKTDELYFRLADQKPPRWMRYMQDAALLQSVHPFRAGIVDLHYNRMIDRSYTSAIRLFMKETSQSRRDAAFDDSAFAQTHLLLSWMDTQLAVPTALEYCVTLSKGSEMDTDLKSFQHVAEIFYYCGCDALIALGEIRALA